MIITCASCYTKFHLDDSKISAKGAKVRCSRCQHVFLIIPPAEIKKEIKEDLKSLIPPPETLKGPSPKEEARPSSEITKRREIVTEKEKEIFSLDQGMFNEKTTEGDLKEPLREERTSTGSFIPKRKVRRRRKHLFLFITLLIFLALLAFVALTLVTELKSTNKLSSYLDTPIKRITHLWKQISGAEREGLEVMSLNGYEEQGGGTPLFIIEGQVKNQSKTDRKHIKIRVILFDQNRAKIAEREIVCGRIMGQEELKNLPETFFKGEMMMEPPLEKEKITPVGKAIPFMVIFKESPSRQAKEFKVEIVEAPSL